MKSIIKIFLVAIPYVSLSQSSHNLGWKFHWDSSWLLQSTGQKAINPGGGLTIYDYVKLKDNNYLSLNAGIKYYSLTSKYYVANVNDTIQFYDLTGQNPDFGKMGITSADFSAGYKKIRFAADKKFHPAFEGGVSAGYNFYAYSWKRGTESVNLSGYRKIIPFVYSEFSFNKTYENEKLVNKYAFRLSYSLLPFFKKNSPVNYSFLSFGISIGF